MREGTSDGYYGAVTRSHDNTRRQPISARDAHGCGPGLCGLPRTRLPGRWVNKTGPSLGVDLPTNLPRGNVGCFKETPESQGRASSLVRWNVVLTALPKQGIQVSVSNRADEILSVVHQR